MTLSGVVISAVVLSGVVTSVVSISVVGVSVVGVVVVAEKEQQSNTHKLIKQEPFNYSTKILT